MPSKEGKVLSLIWFLLLRRPLLVLNAPWVGPSRRKVEVQGFFGCCSFAKRVKNFN
jgi:hypothetical protein